MMIVLVASQSWCDFVDDHLNYHPKRGCSVHWACPHVHSTDMTGLWTDVARKSGTLSITMMVETRLELRIFIVMYAPPWILFQVSCSACVAFLRPMTDIITTSRTRHLPGVICVLLHFKDR